MLLPDFMRWFPFLPSSLSLEGESIHCKNQISFVTTSCMDPQDQDTTLGPWSSPLEPCSHMPNVSPGGFVDAYMDESQGLIVWGQVLSVSLQHLESKTSLYSRSVGLPSPTGREYHAASTCHFCLVLLHYSGSSALDVELYSTLLSLHSGTRHWTCSAVADLWMEKEYLLARSYILPVFHILGISVCHCRKHRILLLLPSAHLVIQILVSTRSWRSVFIFSDITQSVLPPTNPWLHPTVPQPAHTSCKKGYHFLLL